MRSLLTALGALLLFGAASAARADLTIEMKHNDESMSTYVTRHKLASEFGQGGMIFLGEEKVLRILQHEKKRYTEMTEADAKAMGEKMAEARKALESLPPAMREKMQSAMKGAMGGADAKRTIRPLNEKKTINGFPTTGYVVTVEGSKDETEVWATDPQKLGIDPREFAVFKEMAEFMKQMLPGLESMKELIKDYDKPDPDDVPGFPVLTIRRSAEGKEVWRSELVKVDHGAVPEGRFAVPAGYKMEKMKLG